MKPGRLLLYAFAVATPLGCSTVAFVYIGMNAAGRTLSFERALLAGLPDWYFWAAATPLVFWLGDRFRMEKGDWVVAGLVHLVAGIAVALAEIGAVVIFNRAVGVPTFAGAFNDVYLRLILQYFHFNFIIYWVVVVAAHATRYYRSARERELEASRLKAELTEAQLTALQMQLQPHFFFNTLHTIATLVRDGRGEAATDTLARLGDLFRETLGNAKHNEISLRDELRFVEAYLEIERMRFSDRLIVRVDIEPEALDARVPSMALQPLVENAIRHGIARDPSARLVSVEARRCDAMLRVEVQNDGPRYEPRATGAHRQGVGLSNVTARIQRLYGRDGRLTIEPGQSGGTVAILEIPWHRADVRGNSHHGDGHT